MAECPGGRTNRGTRSQFRLGLPSLSQCRGFYPVNTRDIMNASRSSHTGIASSRDLISPSKGTRTLTVREYEQTISELQKENFDLKLKFYLFDEAVRKYASKEIENVSPDQNVVEVVVHLSSEADSLRNELSQKDKLLQDAQEQAEKFETDFKELEKKYSDLQSELASLSELPSKEEFLSFVEEKENLIRHVELLEKTLLEKEEEINTTNQKIEILADSNRVLEEKLKKRSLAIQGFVQKNVREKQMLPDELRNLVISATQAAKQGNKEEFAIAVKSISSALNQIMSLSVVSMNVSEEKENIRSPKFKCLEEEVVEKSKSLSSCQTESPIELSDIQGLREVLSERNIPSTKSFSHLDSVVCDSYAVGKKMKESTVNIAEKDIVDCKNFSTFSPSSQENLISFSSQPSSQTSSVVEQNLIDIEYFPSSPSSSDLIHQRKDISKVDMSAIFGKNSEESNQLMNILKENEQLKLQLRDKLGIIEDLHATCKELELTNSHLQETGSDARKASKLYNVYTQTDIGESNHLNEDQIERFQKDAELSNNVEELREDVKLLLHSIENKNNELLEVKQTLSVVQEDLKKALDTTSVIDKDFYVNERNELHEKLALSCSVNEELMKHLKTLERFMEDLLNNKFHSSRESISDKSDFLTSVSRCLNESLELSSALSKHLSICEGSKLFEDTQSFVQRNNSYLEKRSLPSFSLPELSITERQRHSLSYPGSLKFEEYDNIQKSFDRIQNDSNGSQLCRQCWQQLNRPLNESVSVTSHQVQNDIIPKYGYPSSESDIWSEPDRDVSMQRIGISLQNSPISSKSPRKSKLKLKRSSNRISLDEETTSSERMSKKQNGSASRRLFSKECVKNEDSNIEKFYFLVAEKYSKLKSLLESMENKVNEKDLSDEVNIVTSLKTAFQQLHIAKENAKNFPSVCGNCIMLELFAEIKHYREPDSFTSDPSSEQRVLNQFSEEISSLKDSCKSIFPQLFESFEKISEYTQCDVVSEVKTEELEDEIVDLNSKNQQLSKNLDDLKNLLSTEKEELQSIKTENYKLTSQLDVLKKELFEMKQKESELSVQNEKFVEELNSVNQVNSELNSTLKDLEQKRKESGVLLDQLSAELQKNKSDLHKMSEKCIEYEKKLCDEIHTKEECENNLKTLEATLQSEKNSYLNQIDSLNAEKNNFAQELKQIQEMKLSLENEITSMNDSLCLKNNELLSLQETIQKLQSAKETLKSKNDELQTELKKAKQLIESFQNKIAFYEDEIILKLKENESKLSEELKELETKYLNEKEKLIAEVSELREEREVVLRKMADEKAPFEKLQAEKAELLFLQETIQKLQSAKGTLKSKNNELQTELKKAKQLIDSFRNKIAFYEDEIILQLKGNESNVSEQLKELETKSLNEKEKLIAEVSGLREVVLRKIADEKALFEKLHAEKAELCRKYAESCQNISNLKQINKESENKQLDLQKKSEYFENAFLSSNNECDLLNNDFKSLRETLQNLELKCLFYEKELIATSGMKDCLVECLLNINNEFLIQRRKLNEMCKAYGFDNYVLWDEVSIDENVPVIDENNVQMLCENICSETKKLSQSIDMLLGLLKSYHLKTIETKEKNSMKIMDMKKQLEMFKSETEQIKIQRDQFQLVISELQRSISEKEKSVQYSACEIQSLKEKLFNTEQDIERNNQLLHKKDDEITMLQERIFNLQTYVNSIMTDKTIGNRKNSMLDKSIYDSVSSDNQLPSKLVLRISKPCQTDNSDVTDQCDDNSLLSTSPENAPTQDRRNRCCEKYWNKYRFLQSKLAVCKKHIEILEKEKTDLRENLLQQLQNKQDVSETKDSYSSKLAELESKLEQKKAFISELKGELLKTCNSLIDKEKEVDTLKQKLSELEDKTRQATFDKPDRLSMGSPKSIAANIKTLKNHKWKLIQTIFDIQRKFYEKRGIHLNYFDKFRDHVNNLYSLQLTNSIVKCESLPLLESSNIIDHYEQKDDKIKSLTSLELDIECLENLKIFLNRFFVPCVLQTPKAADEKVAETKEKKVSTETLHVQTNITNLKDLNPEVSSFFSTLCPEVFLIDCNADQTSEGKILSFDIFASTFSYQLDLIQKFFIAVAKCDWIDALDFSAKESSEKAEVKSLLLHIFQEIKSLHETTGKVFKLNALLKKFDCISSSLVPLNTCDNDVSDKESVMSEETIAVSRSESRTSFEDVCPIELPHPETLRLEEETLKPVSTEKKLSVIEPYGSKTTAIGSSCDSVCPRSHYSSPDLGIESDPNHDSSAPEQKDDAINKYQKLILEEQKFRIKSQRKTSFTNTESAGKWLGNGFGDSLYAIGTLQHYELLKQEIKESLVAIKSVLSRTGDGLHHIARYTSPRKTLEYNTLKSIKDTCIHMEVCLKEANNLVGKFWTAPCPTEKEWKLVNEENQDLQEQLTKLKVIIQTQENEYKRALGKLEHAQVQKASMEKKISKKLVKTKKVIRQAELKLLENRCQNFPPLPKYPSSPVEQAEAQYL